MSNPVNLPPFEITHSLVTDISKGLRRIFDSGQILGLYLGGSLAIGDFDENTSDLDFLVVLQVPVSAPELAAVKDLHSKIRATARNQLYKNYEGVYLTASQASHPHTSDMHAPHLGSDGHFEVEDHGAEIIIDLWKIRKSGFVVFGMPPAKTIANISVDEMLEAKSNLFKSWWLPKLRTKEPMNAEYQAYAVLTMARILYGLANRDEVSKKKSAAWCLTAYSDFADLIDAARTWEVGTKFDNIDRVYRLIAFVNDRVNSFNVK